MTWPIALTLTIAGLTTNHTVSEVSFDRANLVTYVEGGNTYICTKAAYDWWSEANTVKLVAPSCAPDALFRNGFDS